MNFTGKYKVTEVRERANGLKSRFVVLAPQDHLSGRTADGCIELLVADENLVPEFAINSVHSVTIAPQASVVRTVAPDPVRDNNPHPADNYAGLVVETDAEAAARVDANRQTRADEAASNRNKGVRA